MCCLSDHPCCQFVWVLSTTLRNSSMGRQWWSQKVGKQSCFYFSDIILTWYVVVLSVGSLVKKTCMNFHPICRYRKFYDACMFTVETSVMVTWILGLKLFKWWGLSCVCTYCPYIFSYFIKGIRQYFVWSRDVLIIMTWGISIYNTSIFGLKLLIHITIHLKFSIIM